MRTSLLLRLVRLVVLVLFHLGLLSLLIVDWVRAGCDEMLVSGDYWQ